VERSRESVLRHADTRCSTQLRVLCCLARQGAEVNFASIEEMTPHRDGFHYKFWVYILSSRSGTLYVGITGFFELRIHQHKYDSIESFTKKYQCHRLVYYESYQDLQVAIAREKQIKRWRREKKIALIEKLNPRWQDLAENWGREMRFQGQSLGRIP
jgi:putative endonuclease